MLKTKDFYLLKVYDLRGKYLGVIDDVFIDFSNGLIKGFSISNYKFFSKKNFIEASNILTIEDVMIIKELGIKKGISFKEIKDIDVRDRNNTILGILEDLIIEKGDYSIKGLIISSGIFDRIFKGKDIFLHKECILGEDFILYYGNNEVKLKTLPRKKRYV